MFLIYTVLKVRNNLKICRTFDNLNISIFLTFYIYLYSFKIYSKSDHLPLSCSKLPSSLTWTLVIAHTIDLFPASTLAPYSLFSIQQPEWLVYNRSQIISFLCSKPYNSFSSQSHKKPKTVWWLLHSCKKCSLFPLTTLTSCPSTFLSLPLYSGYFNLSP